MASRAEEGVETVLRRGRRGSVGVQDGGGFLGARFLVDPVDWRKGVGGGRAHTFIIIVVTIIIVIIIIRRTVPVGNVFHPAELSTNSLGDFVVFWNYDYCSELVSLHTSCGHRPSELVSLHTSCGHRPIFASTNSNHHHHHHHHRHHHRHHHHHHHYHHRS